MTAERRQELEEYANHRDPTSNVWPTPDELRELLADSEALDNAIKVNLAISAMASRTASVSCVACEVLELIKDPSREAEKWRVASFNEALAQEETP